MSSANIFASIIFGSIGFGVFIYGKKQSDLKFICVGIALMAYPYFVQNTIASYVVGILLIASLFVFRG